MPTAATGNFVVRGATLCVGCVPVLLVLDRPEHSHGTVSLQTPEAVIPEVLILILIDGVASSSYVGKKPGMLVCALTHLEASSLTFSMFLNYRSTALG